MSARDGRDHGEFGISRRCNLCELVGDGQNVQGSLVVGLVELRLGSDKLSRMWRGGLSLCNT